LPSSLASVFYVDPRNAQALMAESDHILGVVGFGAGRPDCLGFTGPFVAAPLLPASGSGMLEIWTTPSPVLSHRLGAVTGSCGSGLAFGAVTLDESGHASLEAAVEAAYLSIFDFLAETGFPAPLRFWNYLAAITGDERGIERYRRFNIGRHRAFAARLRQAAPPAASGVGGHKGASVIYFLAAGTPAAPMENPRQISAFDYPPVYGPRSPSFSRAAVWGKTLFISGTASIVGHETRHVGDLDGQIAETINNLQALIAAAEVPAAGKWAVKIYLHDPAFRATVEPAVTGLFGVDSQQLYLHGEICRKDLLVEVEAVLF
jgi:chorismate lyase/3-hydroxybenzoate synthase